MASKKKSEVTLNVSLKTDEDWSSTIEKEASGRFITIEKRSSNSFLG